MSTALLSPVEGESATSPTADALLTAIMVAQDETIIIHRAQCQHQPSLHQPSRSEPDETSNPYPILAPPKILPRRPAGPTRNSLAAGRLEEAPKSCSTTLRPFDNGPWWTQLWTVSPRWRPHRRGDVSGKRNRGDGPCWGETDAISARLRQTVRHTQGLWRRGPGSG